MQLLCIRACPSNASCNIGTLTARVLLSNTKTFHRTQSLKQKQQLQYCTAHCNRKPSKQQFAAWMSHLAQHFKKYRAGSGECPSFLPILNFPCTRARTHTQPAALQALQNTVSRGSARIRVHTSTSKQKKKVKKQSKSKSNTLTPAPSPHVPNLPTYLRHQPILHGQVALG